MSPHPSGLKRPPQTLLYKFHRENKGRQGYLYNYLNFSKALKQVVQRVEHLRRKKGTSRSKLHQSDAD